MPYCSGKPVNWLPLPIKYVAETFPTTVKTFDALLNVKLLFASALPFVLNNTSVLAPGTTILFDTVVPQDDLYAIADAAGAQLAYAYSTFGG